MYAADFRWWAIVLHYAYSIPCEQVGRIFGVSGRVSRWFKKFKCNGHVEPGKQPKNSRHSEEFVSFVSSYVAEHPCFYVEELHEELKQRFGHNMKGVSATSLLRLLRFELSLTRKVLKRRAREAVPQEIECFVVKMNKLYSYPEQLVFIDETSKNGMDAMRRYTWSRKGERAVARSPFARGNRVSIMAACDPRASCLGVQLVVPSLG
ncbi:Transposase [Phytophthora megakarya]|uniref:Transposase n=1 Tax=Phytophthora megakarya TaxID=4795 RepID=A0A225V242_9STRA|nr:Transposase [Phytophthora megakarya]